MCAMLTAQDTLSVLLKMSSEVQNANTLCIMHLVWCKYWILVLLTGYVPHFLLVVVNLQVVLVSQIVTGRLIPTFQHANLIRIIHPLLIRNQIHIWSRIIINTSHITSHVRLLMIYLISLQGVANTGCEFRPAERRLTTVFFPLVIILRLLTWD
jgi:hypothetical protein